MRFHFHVRGCTAWLGQFPKGGPNQNLLLFLMRIAGSLWRAPRLALWSLLSLLSLPKRAQALTVPPAAER